MILETNSALEQKNKATSKTVLANDLGVSRQLLYYQPKLPDKDLLLCSQIKEVMVKHRSYGYRRIAIELKVNHKRVLRVMNLFNLRAKRLPKMPVKSKDKGFVEVENASNLIIKLEINRPNQVWAADFTYLYFFTRFYYLATVIDAFTREIIGYQISNRHNTKLVADALFDAIKKRKNTIPEIFHSDQGSEYRSKYFSKLLKERKIKISMSKKASPWENGRQESLYGKFKLELGHPEIYQTIGELIEAIALQIYYHNNERIHSVHKCPPRVFYESQIRLASSVKASATNISAKQTPKKSPDILGLVRFFGLRPLYYWKKKILYRKW
jgi:putative transposase